MEQKMTPHPSVAAWPVWKQPAKSAPAAPNRLTAVIQAGVILALATLLLLFKKHPVLCITLYVIGTLLMIGGLFIPPLYRLFDHVGKWLGRVVGKALTWLLLVPFFFLCFPFARLVLRLRGIDPMTRNCDRQTASYWIDRKPVTDTAHYTRQY